MLPLTPFVAFENVTSPDGRLVASFRIDAEGRPLYSIRRDGKTVLAESRLGLVREDGDFSRGLALVSASGPEAVRDRYEILTAKRRRNDYRANRRVYSLKGSAGRLDITFQVSDDGLAYRYTFPERSKQTHRLQSEATSFRLPAGARAWMQPMQRAKTGFGRSNPAYEEFYLKDVPVGTPSPSGVGWVYPALFRTDDTWLLISEVGVSRRYCGTRLLPGERREEYRVGFPDPRESILNGPVNPEGELPWTTPWRIVVVGSLKTIAESNLGNDVAEKAAVKLPHAPEPGKAAWSWPLMGDPSANYETQRQFIDYAADMKWKYVLIDALWDVQIGYEKAKELVDYARTKDVSILLWYNSRGDWNETPQTPRDRLITHDRRIEEFERLKAMGVAGLKIDFFGADGQSAMAYYEDIMEDAAPYGLLLNFHGATLPRGWQRKYPHLMTVEAIKGFEFITFGQDAANEQPAHSTMLPFTRNVFDPMDFTPMALDRINNRIRRRTTSAFELALSVVFTSGIQHYPEVPAGMAKAPEYVREFLRGVPSVWDEIRFLDGYPGRFVAIARKGDGHWYVAGINGENAPRTLSLDLRELGRRGKGALIADGDGGNLSFRQAEVTGDRLDIELPPHGGFVVRFGD
jgi:hypothetical protein